VGIFNINWNGGDGQRPSDDTRLKFGGNVQGQYALSPYVGLFASAGYSRYVLPVNLPQNSLAVGLGVSFNLSEMLNRQTRIRGEKIEQRPVFPVSYAWYQNNPVATVRIINNEPNTITDVSLSFFMEQYMRSPTVFASIPRLGPGESTEVPVTALFNESMLDLLENTNANSRVLIDYRSLGARKSAELPVQMPVYHRNAMSWDDDQRAASFVSARDPAAVYFARYVEAAVRGNLRAGAPRNVQYALALFEALNSYGINYVIDPASSYIEMAEDASALDSLNYPYQTLMYRGGDCDDLSILFCSLLEVLGIDTAFITAPGHIYAAFVASSQDEMASEFWLSQNSTNLIEYGGKLWVPVEITIPGEGFNRAWQTGMREWRSAGGTLVNGRGSPLSEAALYPMRESWDLYQPVSVPGAGDRLPTMPEESEIVRRFGAEMGRLAP
jgi:transglutaminase-like putative cysteine protease